MLFGPGILIAGGSFIAITLLDKLAEEVGIYWIGTTLKLLIPVIAMVASIYFLETNALLRWLR
ncbi:hypothetical protein ACT8ZR_15725 [Neobacillus sp. M.A.Huq-85]